MSSLIRSILVLFVYLTAIYNLDRLGLQAGVNFILYPVFYIVMTIAVFGTIAIANSVKMRLVGHISAWSGIYLLGRWILYPTSLFWAGMNIYQTVTEVTLLAVAVALAYHLANQLHKVDELGKIITLPTSARQVRNFNSAIEDIKVEFVRSRRYNHPLSLMIIEPSQFPVKEDVERIIRENQKKISRRYLISQLAEIIITQSRRTDMVMTKNWDGRFIVLCPENNTTGTITLAQRIQADVKANLGVPVHYGIAAFPADALTLEELLRHAETNMVTAGQIPYISGQVMEKPVSVTSIGMQPKEIKDKDVSLDHKPEMLPGPSGKNHQKE